MLHTDRVWKIVPVHDGDQLARNLTESTWCRCCGFEHEGVYFLNDSTSPDAVQEYAVVRGRDLVQTESVTFGWMTVEEAREMIPELVRPDATAYFRFVVPSAQVQPPDEHGTCRHCA